MSATTLKRWVRDVALVVLGAVLGLALSVGWESYKQRKTKIDFEQRQPLDVLNQAEEKRRQLTESSLASAVELLRQALILVDKSKSLDSAKKREYEALAYSKLGRTFANWATVRSMRGLLRGDFPQQAQSYSMKALTIAPGLSEAQISLAYAFSSAEAEQADMPATRNQVTEILKTINNQDVYFVDARYLLWKCATTEDAKSTPEKLKAADISDLLILVDLGVHFARLGATDQDSANKEAHFSRSADFLNRASQLGQNNPIVMFGQGYLSASRNNIAEARDYYRKAVEQEPAFPRARNNWGYTYAVEGLFREAKEQFEAAVQVAVGAPTLSLTRWLDNLGYASLEIGDTTRACQVWRQSASTPGANDNPRTFLGLAMCDYANGQKEEALIQFRHSLAVAQNWNKNPKNSPVQPQDRQWYQIEKAGPKQLKIATELIQSSQNVAKAWPSVER